MIEVPFLALLVAMADHRLLPGVDRELDLVTETVSTDLDPARLAVEDERHRQDGLQRIALGAAVGATYASRLETRLEKSRISVTVSGGMPKPLSITVIAPGSTCTRSPG